MKKPTAITEEKMKSIGEKIKFIREGLNLPRREFAEKVGISAGRLSILERGLGLPSLTTLEKIGDALEIKGRDLIDF